MVIHNITYCVDRTLAPVFLEWLRAEYIPRAEEAGLEVQALARVMGSADPLADSYALQLLAQGLGDVKRWVGGTGAALAGEIATRWGRRVVHFETNLQVL
ncbi:MAG: DUF4286 family protein [Muribaculaceae bacterium]|nr:DUF4286 family protein [Muribaculaceae bacterium]